jgi:hypothetical protein
MSMVFHRCTTGYGIRNFLYAEDIDFTHIKEVTMYCLDDSLGYITHYNIVIKQHGTAIVVRDGITLTNKDIQVDGPRRDGLTMFFWSISTQTPVQIGGPKEKQSLMPR